MGYTILNTKQANEATGYFKHRETKKYFRYSPIVEGDWEYTTIPAGNWDREPGAFDHEIHVKDATHPSGLSYRLAKILKTVAYVVVDEDEDGFAIIERWPLTDHVAISDLH